MRLLLLAGKVILTIGNQMPEGMEPPRVYKLPRNSSIEYAFDQPAQHLKAITVWEAGRPRFRREVGIMEIGPQKPFIVPVCSTVLIPAHANL